MRLLVCVLALLGGCSGAKRDEPDLANVQDMSVANLDLTGIDGPPGVSIAINEFNPNGANEATDPDWVEIKNLGAATVDLSGYKVRDDKPADDTTLPPGTTVPPGGYLIIFCDDAVDGGVTGGLHVPFKLSGSAGDEFHVTTPNGVEVAVANFAANAVTAGKTWGRVPDGTGAFMLTTPTRGTANMP